MSGIPTPRSGIARPSKLAAPGTMQPTKRARAEAEETQPSKKAKPSMPPPKVAPVKKTHRFVVDSKKAPFYAQYIGLQDQPESKSYSQPK